MFLISCANAQGNLDLLDFEVHRHAETLVNVFPLAQWHPFSSNTKDTKWAQLWVYLREFCFSFEINRVGGARKGLSASDLNSFD